MQALYLAWQYLKFNKVKTAILVTAITLVIYLPIALKVVVSQSSEQLMARANNTALLLGAQGSPVERVLNSLYFGESRDQTGSLGAALNYADIDVVETSGYANAIPLYVGFKSQEFPIVGTSLAYLNYRDLNLESGRNFAFLGEAVIGAAVAKKQKLSVGDHVISSPQSLFDLAGVYPLKMKVVGILKPAFTPDDNAIFVDLKTTWVIQGLGHGHQDLSKPEANKAVLKKQGAKIIANASVVQYNEISSTNIDSFHFHGDPGTYPLTGILPVTHSHRDQTLLLGEFENKDPRLQMIEPKKVVAELVQTLLQLEQYIMLGALLVGLGTLLVVCTVFVLSQKLRTKEFDTLDRMGGPKSFVMTLQLTEGLIVLILSLSMAGLLTWITHTWGITLVQELLF